MDEEKIVAKTEIAPEEEGASKDKRKKRERTPEEKKKLLLRICIPIISVVLATGVFFAGFFVREGTLGEEMQTLIRIKETLQREYYEKITDEEFYEALFDAVNENLLDDYSYYMSSEEYARVRAEGAGKQSGLGLALYTGGGKVRILRVIGNSPAEKAGFLAGDIVSKYGVGETLTEATTSTEFSSFVAKTSTSVDITVEVLRGEEKVSITLKKQTYAEGYVFYRTATSAYRCAGSDALSFVAGGEPLVGLAQDTAYIRLTGFNGDATKQFGYAMSRFKADGKKNLLLDLRANGGGYMDIFQDIAKYFCKSSKNLLPLVATADYGERKQNYYALGNEYDKYFKSDSKIYLIADEGTASASEALLGVMLDYGATAPNQVYLVERGGVAKTYGKGIMQTTFDLIGGESGDAIKLTTAKLYWPVSGKCIHARGYLTEDGAQALPAGETEEEELTLLLAKIKGE